MAAGIADLSSAILSPRLSLSVAKAGFQLGSSSGITSTLGLLSEGLEFKQRDRLHFSLSQIPLFEVHAAPN